MFRPLLILFSVFLVSVCADAAKLSSALNLKEPSNHIPDKLKEIGIVEQLGKDVDPTLIFTNQNGEEVKIGSFFSKDRPVLLSLVYFGCPNLCNFYFNGLIEALKKSQWTTGKEFELLVVSIDPKENSDLALQKRAELLKDYGREGAKKGWHFLTGKKDQIEKLASQVGFGFRWDEETQQFAHAAAAIILTPEGKVSRYLYGINFLETTFRLSLAEASKGRVGSIVERVLLFCFRFDPTQRKYSIYAMNVMKAGGAATVLVLLTVLIPFWRKQSRNSKQQGES